MNVKLYHPGLKRYHTVPSQRVADVYARSGWQPVSAETLAGQHTRDELDQIAVEHDVDPDGYDTKTDLATALVDED
jgi:hypothetical protein